MEKTFVMIKPGGVQRNLVGEVIKRFEQKGLVINALKMIYVSNEQAQKHYDIHKEKPFFNSLVTAITSSPVVVMVVSGNNAIKTVRILAGDTNPLLAQPGTIRGDFSSDIQMNVIHSADSIERANYEIMIYFNDDEVLDYDKKLNSFVYLG